jgi:hypothetical protein
MSVSSAYFRREMHKLPLKFSPFKKSFSAALLNRTDKPSIITISKRKGDRGSPCRISFF